MDLGLSPAQSRVAGLGTGSGRKGASFSEGWIFRFEVLVCWLTLRDLLYFPPFWALLSLYKDVVLSSTYFPSDPSLKSDLLLMIYIRVLLGILGFCLVTQPASILDQILCVKLSRLPPDVGGTQLCMEPMPRAALSTALFLFLHMRRSPVLALSLTWWLLLVPVILLELNCRQPLAILNRSTLV